MNLAPWRTVPSSGAAVCLSRIELFDEVVAAAGVADAGHARIEDFPYLRVSRLLASFNSTLPQDPSWAAYVDWLQQMRDLDAEARRIEAANLPASQRQSLSRQLGTDSPAASLNTCAESLLAEELLGADDSVAREALENAVEAPDHYLTAWRVMGLYPLTSVAIAAGYEGWKNEYLAGFGQHSSATPDSVASEATWYTPAPVADDRDADSIARWVRDAPRTPLGLLDISGDDLLRLAGWYAPLFAITARNHDDALGSPYWRAGPEGPLPAVDTNHPVADVRLAHTRFHGRVLPQLVYTVWFPARTRSGATDILGGRLDGLVWRVTLGEDGRPLIHDSIHPCGCYHLFFPVPPLQRIEVPADHGLAEAPLSPAAAPLLTDGQRMALHLAATSHFLHNLTAISTAPSAAIPYRLRLVNEAPDYGRRSLALPEGGRLSLYDDQGVVPDTERLERFLLWPSGIRSPGAMRQWGTHATVFVGRRHFDDPFLFEEAFARPQ